MSPRLQIIRGIIERSKHDTENLERISNHVDYEKFGFLLSLLVSCIILCLMYEGIGIGQS